MNLQIAMEMQRICTGESRELTKGEIVSGIIDLEELTAGFKPETVEKCTAFYNEMVNDNEKKVYNADTLFDEIQTIKSEFKKFMRTDKDAAFRRFYDDVGEFLMIPRFEGLDDIAYGIHEVCVFSILEYFAWKLIEGYDHDKCHKEYRDNIAERTHEEVADHWMKVYDDLQERYDRFNFNLDDEYELKCKITACSIMAITAIRDQDDFALDMAQGSAEKKAKEIVDSRMNNTYEEGDSTFVDNAVKMYDFVYLNAREFKGQL